MTRSFILTACSLVALTVSVHTIGLAGLLKGFGKFRSSPPTRFWPITWMLIRIVWALILVHAIEISIWALLYLWNGCFADASSAFYFSGVTYTTLGYGDLLLSGDWRLLAPIEALSGILMCGLSTGFFFAVVSTLLHAESPANPGTS